MPPEELQKLQKEVKDLTELVEDLQVKITQNVWEYGGIMRIGSGDIRSKNFQSGIKGWRLSGNGELEIGTIFFNKQFVLTNFESFDGWTKTAGVNSALGGANIQTSSSSGTQRSANAEVTGTPNEVDFDNRNPIFEAQFFLSAITNQTIYAGVGDLNVGDGTEYGFGFKIVNGVLSALSTFSDGGSADETLTTISGITLTDMNTFKAIMNSVKNEIKFYVNGLLKATHRSADNLPDGTSPVILSFSIVNSASENKTLYLRRAVFSQDL